MGSRGRGRENRGKGKGGEEIGRDESMKMATREMVMEEESNIM